MYVSEHSAQVVIAQLHGSEEPGVEEHLLITVLLSLQLPGAQLPLLHAVSSC